MISPSLFERRLAKKLIETRQEGALMLHDRETQKVLGWTSEARDPVAAGQYWFG